MIKEAFAVLLSFVVAYALFFFPPLFTDAFDRSNATVQPVQVDGLSGYGGEVMRNVFSFVPALLSYAMAAAVILYAVAGLVRTFRGDEEG